MKFLVSILILFGATIVNADTVYRWQDKNGRWHFSDRPVDGADTVAIQTQDITPVDWKSTPEIEVEKATSATPGGKTFSKKRKRCEFLNRKAQHYAKKSKKHLGNPKYKEKKREYRWKIQKEC